MGMWMTKSRIMEERDRDELSEIDNAQVGKEEEEEGRGEEKEERDQERKNKEKSKKKRD